MRRRDFIVVLVAGGMLSACGRKAKLPPVPPGASVLAFGDSVTFGVGAPPGEDWPSRLARSTGWKVRNAGVSGDTAEAGKTRLQPLLDELQPALVIVEIGGNDFLRRRPPQAVKEDLRQIVRDARRSSAQVVLVAVPELSLLGALARRPADAPLFRELAEEEHIPLVSEVFSDILAHPELCADQIHPNANGYQQMASGILARLKLLGLAPASAS